jgi:hypothetical protein
VRRSLLLALVLVGCAKGDKLGQLDLQAKDATFALDAAPGETLHFQLDCKLDVPSMEGKSNRDAKYKIYDAMKRSTVTIAVMDDAGQTRTTTCQGYEIGSTHETHAYGSRMEETGMPLDCTLPIAKAGRHTVTGSVRWDAMLVARETKLEIRKAKKK